MAVPFASTEAFDSSCQEEDPASYIPVYETFENVHAGQFVSTSFPSKSLL